MKTFCKFGKGYKNVQKKKLFWQYMCENNLQFLVVSGM